MAVKMFEKDGKVCQVQIEVGVDVFAVRKKAGGYEAQIAGRRAFVLEYSDLLEFMGGLLQVTNRMLRRRPLELNSASSGAEQHLVGRPGEAVAQAVEQT